MQLPFHNAYLWVGDGLDYVLHLFVPLRCFFVDFKLRAVLGVNQTDSIAADRMVFHRTEVDQQPKLGTGQKHGGVLVRVLHFFC